MSSGSDFTRVDFTQLSSEGFEELVGEYLKAKGLEVTGLSRGPDDGVDLIATQTQSRELGPADRHRTLVQCKHYTKKAVAVADLDDVIVRCTQHGADAYLLVASSAISSSVEQLRKDLNDRQNGPSMTIWNGKEFERRLLALESSTALLRRFFGSVSIPRSRASAKPTRASLSESIREKFSLRRVEVAETPTDAALLYDSLGTVAARYFADSVPQHAVVGVTCGRTIFQMADNLPALTRRLRVYPISFNVGPTLTSVMSPWLTIHRICERVNGAEGYELPLHAFLIDPETEWKSIRARPDTWELIQRSRRPSVAFYSVGHLEPSSSYDWTAEKLRLVLPGFHTDDLRALGACGEINWYPFTIDGAFVDHPIVRHGTSLGLPDIQRLAATREHQMVLVAGGQAKVKPIVGALRGRLLNVLITDEETLEEVARLV